MRTLPFLGRKFQLDIRSDADESVMAEIFTLREYMPVEPILKGAKHAVLDIGAHKGFFALYVRALNEEVPVYCYEPEEANFRALKTHLELNKIQGVMAKNSAVMDCEGMAVLHVSEDSHNHSLVMVPGTTKEQKVNTTTLEKIVAKIGAVDLVKMDIEGAEFQILLNAPDAIFAQCSAFFLETHEYNDSMHASTLKTLFEKKGYTVQLTPSKYDKRLGFLWAVRTRKS